MNQFEIDRNYIFMTVKIETNLLTVFIFILGLSSGCTSKKDLPEQPNVLYISMEDLSPRLGCYGDTVVKSPNIDQFAKESVLFEDVHCQVALCTPSRTSILTGIRPSTSGIVKIDDNWKKILPETTSMPRHFKDNGYMTYRVGKISDPRSGGPDDAWTISEEEWGVETNDKPLKAMEQVFNQEKPFFLAIGYKQTHDPWDPSERALNMYDWENVNVQGPDRTFKKEKITDAEAKELAHHYYADITDVDSLIGDLIKKIKGTEFYNNTIILVGVMDHGYSLGYHDKWGKGGLYDSETQVPLLIRLPANKNNGKRASGLVELVDIYPTLVDLCNLPFPSQQLEGYSLRGLLEEPNKEWKKAVFAHRAYNVNAIGMKTKEYNLISGGNGNYKLFDRINDPRNLNNIAGDKPEVVEELRTIMGKGWKNAIPVE